ncbi:unnamed protein product [Adineta steineri]|uniref:Uncharacterized protein n=1 Tax=Adineta steineri TaxID=433720 RepID=A0A815J8Y5_9BILA|nr:unnamed protein product [Adineta steineri]CAF1376163.1 unnamed protein product [Adineta steineri]
MPLAPTTTKSTQHRSPSSILIEDNDDAQPHVTFLKQQKYTGKKTSMNTSNTGISSASTSDRIPPNLLEMKKQRLIAAADRKKRIITRIISIIGLLIILLCAGIVALTLKMAPKIDELVRTKSGAHHPSVHLQSRILMSLNTVTNEYHNFTSNTSST